MPAARTAPRVSACGCDTEDGGVAADAYDREAHGVVEGRRGSFAAAEPYATATATSVISIGPSPYASGTVTTSPTPTAQVPTAHGPAGEGVSGPSAGEWRGPARRVLSRCRTLRMRTNTT